MKHIFIIEDNIGILEALTFLLENNYQITAMIDARRALKKLQTEQPDLILLDLVMPNLNGAEFIEALAQLKLNVPILLMTASSNISQQINFSSIADVIHKPFQIEEIETSIKNIFCRIKK